MMKNHEKRVPEVRFKGYIEDWEQRKFSEGTKKIGDGLHGTPKYSDDGKVAFINGNNLVNGKIVITSETKYVTEIEQSKDDRTLSVDTIFMSINGTIGNLAWYSGEKLMLGKSIAYIEVDKYNKRFIYSFLQTTQAKAHFMKSLTGTTIKNLGLKTIRDTLLYAPSNKEQEQIGGFFEQLDNTIALHQRKIDLLKQLRKGYLQKMFPKNRGGNPGLRFTKFDVRWEQRKFKDFISKAGKKNTSGENYQAYSVSNKLGLVRQTEQFDGSRLDDLDKTSYKLVNANEFAYNPARVNVGSIAFNNINKTVIVSSLYVVLKMNEKLDNDYILQFIKSRAFIDEVKRNTEGSVREYLFFENFKNIKFPYSPSKDEQKKIGYFFKQLDDTISLHQIKLEKLQQIKKSFLQKMFI